MIDGLSSSSQPVKWQETEAMVSGPLKELLNYTTGISFEGFAAAESELNFFSLLSLPLAPLTLTLPVLTLPPPPSL